MFPQPPVLIVLCCEHVCVLSLQEVFPGASGSSSSGGGGAAGGSAGGADIMLLSFEEFKAVMDDFDVRPLHRHKMLFVSLSFSAAFNNRRLDKQALAGSLINQPAAVICQLTEA